MNLFVLHSLPNPIVFLVAHKASLQAKSYALVFKTYLNIAVFIRFTNQKLEYAFQTLFYGESILLSVQEVLSHFL